MVKPLKDILAEIEERQPVRRFQAGGMGGPDEEQGSMAGDIGDSFSDPGQDDTLGEEDEGIATLDDYQGLMDAGAYHDPSNVVTIDPDTGHPIYDVNMTDVLTDLHFANKDHQQAVSQANLEQLGYLFHDPSHMEAVEKGTVWADKDKQSFIEDKLSSPSFLEGLIDPGSLGVGLVGMGLGIPFAGSIYNYAVDKAKDPARQAMVQNLSSKGYSPTQIQQTLAGMGVKGLNVNDIKDLSAGVKKGDIEKTQFSDVIPDAPTLGIEGSEDPWIPPVKPTTMIAEKMVEDVVQTTPGKGWSFDPGTWYPSAQGGPIESYQMGGLAGMMNKQMGLQQQYQDEMWQTMTPEQRNQYRGGNRPARPPQHGGFGLGLPRPPGFFDPRGTRPPPQQPRLEPETYFHEHEGGKVTYPNFPKPFVNPPDRPNNWKGGGGQQIATKPFQTLDTLNEQYEQFTSSLLEEAPRPEPYSPLEPVPPISISETTATAMEPEAVEEATQTTIEEARPVPREIDIQMPENVTATLDFPEEVRGTANYRRGGIASLLRGRAPLAAGWALGPMGHIPAMMAGAGTQYALAGKKRSFLDAIKGGLAGYSGSGVSRLGTATADASTSAGDIKDIGKKFLPTGATDKTTYLADAYENLAPTDWMKTPTSWSSYGADLAKSGKGLWEGLSSLNPATYQALAGEMAGPAAAMIGQTAITTPAERPEVAEIAVAQYQAMTPEQRRAYIESKRAKYGSSPMMQPTVFAPPNVDIGWQPNYAAEGGVMEIDEEMESGSFVLPADVVSNVGDGSSDAGHRRLTQLFGGSDEYALGGGTGILKGPVKGVGSGLDDLIQTGIDGVRVARLSSDEFVVPKDVVRRLGDGSQKAGSEKLYDFMKDVRLKKHGTAEQPKEMHMSGLRKMV